MSRTRVNRSIYAVGAVLALVGALLLGTPAAGLAHAGPAGPAGTAISIGDPAAPGQVDLYLDPLCLYSGKMIQAQGEEIGRRIEAGTLHVNVRFVDFLDKDSASGSYDYRAIYAAYVVAGQSASSAVTWNFIREIFAAENQPRRHGPTDLSNDQLAGLADRAGAPHLAGSSSSSASRSAWTRAPSPPTTSPCCATCPNPASRASWSTARPWMETPTGWPDSRAEPPHL